MSKLFSYIFAALALVMAVGCADDSFSLSPSNTLSFPNDTIRLDTLFSTVPSSTRSMWIYNRSGSGIRCASVRLERGNQSGFRVNVDGAFLGTESGFRLNNVEIPKGDSIRIFVEATLPMTYSNEPTEMEDNLVFTLESGTVQKLNLNAWAWDAETLHDLIVTESLTISAGKPIIVYGSLTVSEGATLTIEPGVTLYFHNNAGLNIEGRLLCEGSAEKPITLRGDRLDNMFDYLPYDRVSGQWQGVHFAEQSYNNSIVFTDIHGTYNGIVIDSAAVDKKKLDLVCSTVHNCQGNGVRIENGMVFIENSQLTNTAGYCLRIDGGLVYVNNCTIAQYYPFIGARGNAMYINNFRAPLLTMLCENSIITGYADDELFGEYDELDKEKEFVYTFKDCIIRTPVVESDDSVLYKNVVFENPEDTVTTGKKLFRLVDSNNQRYDFHLSPDAVAIGKADKETAPRTDHDGMPRDDEPDLGAYESLNKETEE